MTISEVKAIEKDWQLEQEIEERRLGRLCAIVANIGRDVKKQSSPFREEDFIFRYGHNEKDRQKEEAERMKAQMRAMFGPPNVNKTDA